MVNSLEGRGKRRIGIPFVAMTRWWVGVKVGWGGESVVEEDVDEEDERMAVFSEGVRSEGV